MNEPLSRRKPRRPRPRPPIAESNEAELQGAAGVGGHRGGDSGGRSSYAGRQAEVEQASTAGHAALADACRAMEAAQHEVERLYHRWEELAKRSALINEEVRQQ